MSAVEEFADFLKGNFVHINDEMFYIINYDKDTNRFFLTGSGDAQHQNKDLYMYELMRELEKNKCELYIEFVDKFPEYFV